MIAQVLRGAGFALGGFGWLRRPGLRRFLLVPLLINLLVFGAAATYSLTRFGDWLETLLPASLGWLWWVLLPLAAIVLLVVVYFTFTMVANLLASPFNDRLAERVADRLGHRIDETQRAGAWAGQILKATLGELRKWLYFAFLALLALACWLFPPTTLLAPWVWLLVGIWIFAFEYLDYPLGNAGLGFGGKHRWIREHRWYALGFGGTLTVMTLIPVVNFAVMPAAVCGATELWVYCERRERA
ncbi:MAG: sulfate transporter CysZ [Pseudomonadota bacterium]